MVFSPDGILAVGEVDVPAGATVVDGTGATLLPGLFDAHQHVLGERPLRRNADFGVTTALDMFNDPAFASQIGAAQAAGDAADRADLFSAGNLATPPGGHGTQFGVTNLATIARPEHAGEWVRRRAEEGSDWIKVVVEHGRPGAPLPTLDRATVAALVTAAHDRDLLVVAHVSRSDDARMVVEAGVDGLAHVWLDGSAPDVVGLLADREVFVVPTLSVYDDRPVSIGQRLVDDPDLGPRLFADEVSDLDQSLPVTSLLTELALTSVGDLDEAGVTILAGTDVGNPGVVAGASLHGELELLVEAGLTPIEALEAATLAPADAFGLLDRGRIEPDARADLVLVEGDPVADITATRAIDTVWKAGVEIDRDLP